MQIDLSGQTCRPRLTLLTSYSAIYAYLKKKKKKFYRKSDSWYDDLDFFNFKI